MVHLTFLMQSSLFGTCCTFLTQSSLFGTCSPKSLVFNHFGPVAPWDILCHYCSPKQFWLYKLYIMYSAKSNYPHYTNVVFISCPHMHKAKENLSLYV